MKKRIYKRLDKIKDDNDDFSRSLMRWNQLYFLGNAFHCVNYRKLRKDHLLEFFEIVIRQNNKSF